MEEQNLSPTPSPEARQWAMFCHFAAFAGLLIPFGNLLGPLVVWQLKRDFDPFVDDQGKMRQRTSDTVELVGDNCFQFSRACRLHHFFPRAVVWLPGCDLLSLRTPAQSD